MRPRRLISSALVVAVVVLVMVTTSSKTLGLPPVAPDPLRPYDIQSDINAEVGERVAALEDQVELLTETVNELIEFATEARLAAAAAATDPALREAVARMQKEVGPIPAVSTARADLARLRQRLEQMERMQPRQMRQPVPKSRDNRN